MSSHSVAEYGLSTEWSCLILFVCVEWASPIVWHRPAGILTRLGVFAEVREHWVDRALERHLARPDCLLYGLKLSTRAQALKLFVQVEHHGRIPDGSC